MSALFFKLSSTYFWYFSVLGLALPFLAVFLDGRGFSSLEIGEILAIFTATKIVGPTLWATIADKKGEQLSIIRLGSFLSLACFCYLFWAQGYWPITFALAMFSLFWTAILPQLEVMTLASIKRSAKIYARIRLWGSIGFIALSVVSGEVIEAYSSEAVTYIGLFILICLWLSTLTLKQPRLPKQASVRVGSIFNKLNDKNFIAFFIAGLLLQMSFGPFYSFFALFLRDLEYPAYAVGVFIGVGVLAEIGIFLLLGFFFNRYRLSQLIMVSIFLSSIRWYLTGEYGEIPLILGLAQLLHAFSFGLYHSASIQYLQNHFDKNQQSRGQAIYIAGVYGVGGAIGAYIAGVYWLDGAGATQSYYIAALLALLGGGFSLLIKENKSEKKVA